MFSKPFFFSIIIFIFPASFHRVYSLTFADALQYYGLQNIFIMLLWSETPQETLNLHSLYSVKSMCVNHTELTCMTDLLTFLFSGWSWLCPCVLTSCHFSVLQTKLPNGNHRRRVCVRGRRRAHTQQSRGGDGRMCPGFISLNVFCSF